MSTLKITNLQNPSAASPAIVLAADGTATAQLSSVNGGPFGTRNKVIGGCMRIDQRNAGASVNNNSAANVYTVDRFLIYGNQSNKFSAQQNAGSVTPPAGFSHYLGLTSLSAYTVAAGETFTLQHRIEGYNTSDLAWGTANAKTVTLSFWVRSSLTGTFGGAISNSAANRSYPFSYTISAANTWEQKTITIAGDTTGTWLTDNGIGINLTWSLGAGSTYSGTAGAWSGSTLVSATGATSVVGTNGATFYLTGVQLESGSTSTPYQRRSFTTELQLCQRYYEKSYAINTKPGTVTTGATTVAVFPAAYTTYFVCPFQVSKRTTPTMTAYSPSSGAVNYQSQNMATDIALAGWISSGVNSATVYSAVSANTSNYVHFTAEAEL